MTTTTNAATSTVDMAAAFAAAETAKAVADANKPEAAWYNCTTAKVAGGLVLGVAVGAAVYYGYKHFFGANGESLPAPEVL